MNPVSKLMDVEEKGHEYKSLVFCCPGCDNAIHMLPVAGDVPPGKPRWEFNGDENSPTLSPSILSRYSGADGERVCHSFMRNGVFEFLGDCTHEFAGQNVPVPPLPDWWIQQ